MGVAVVVPAQTIGAVLDQPDIKRERDDAERACAFPSWPAAPTVRGST